MKIIKDNHLFTFFSRSSTYRNLGKLCEYCRFTIVDDYYVDLIETLKEKNLLSQDYKLRCCFCNYVSQNIESVFSIDERFDRLHIWFSVLDEEVEVVYNVDFFALKNSLIGKMLVGLKTMRSFVNNSFIGSGTKTKDPITPRSIVERQFPDDPIENFRFFYDNTEVSPDYWLRNIYKLKIIRK